jgi:hypothetical protein
MQNYLQCNCEYYEVQDCSREPHNEVEEGDKYVYTEIKAQMTREKYLEVMGDEEDFEQTNKGKHLMIFNDKSPSMLGLPFKLLKDACLGIAETLFTGLNGDKCFESTTVVFYD